MDLLSPTSTQGVDASSFLKSDVAYHRIEDESAKFNLNSILDVRIDLSDADIDFLDASLDAELPILFLRLVSVSLAVSSMRS